MLAIGFLAALPAVGGLIGSLFGRGASAAGDSRLDQNSQNILNNRNTIDQYGIEQSASTSAHNTQQQALIQALLAGSNEQTAHAQTDLDRRKFALDAPQTRGRQALLGSLMQNLQPARLTGLSRQLQAAKPTFTGGLSPAAIGPQARQAGALMQSGAVRGLQQGDTFDPLKPTDFRSGVLDPTRAAVPRPELQELQKSGLLEKILGGVGIGGTLLGALGPLLQGRGTNNLDPESDI
jgi:hypothetical protein